MSSIMVASLWSAIERPERDLRDMLPADATGGAGERHRQRSSGGGADGSQCVVEEHPPRLPAAEPSAVQQVDRLSGGHADAGGGVLQAAAGALAPRPGLLLEPPCVDVFICCCSEPVDVVEPTVVAALNLDYPSERLAVGGRAGRVHAWCEGQDKYDGCSGPGKGLTSRHPGILLAAA